ncbi:MAG: hypothetical protein AAF602_25640 [Myxococcota bacterium]
MRLLTSCLVLVACSGEIDDPTPTETDADTDADTDSDSDADTDTDGGPTNLLTNPGFEAVVADPVSPIDNEAITGTYPADYVWRDPRSEAWSASMTGEPIEGSDPFTARTGSYALKLVPRTDDQRETRFEVYQELPIGDQGVDEGDRFTLSAWAFTASADALAGHNQAYLSLKAFDADGEQLLYATSEPVTTGTLSDQWLELRVTSTVPEGSVALRAVYELLDCAGQAALCVDGGSIYFDDGSLVEVSAP